FPWRPDAAGPGRVCAGPGGSVLRSADHGGGVSATRVPGRRQRRPVHAQHRRHWRGAQEERRGGPGGGPRQTPSPPGPAASFLPTPPPPGGGPRAVRPPPPPRAGRSRGLAPSWGASSRGGGRGGVEGEDREAPRPGRVPPFARMPRLPGLPQVPVPVLGFADEAASRVGHVDPEVISYAQALHDDMPDVLRVAAQEPFSARALVYALLLDPRADLRDLQLTRLQAGAEPQDFAETFRL